MDKPFRLTDNFISDYIDQQPNFGPLGYVVYKRTYARRVEDLPERLRELAKRGKIGETEEWWLTCIRVVEGVYNIQKRHCGGLRLPWNDRKAQKSAQEMFRRMWDFKWLPPGRGLWMMGLDYIQEKLGAALNNPLHVDTNVLTREYGWVRLGDISGEQVHVLSSTHNYGSNAQNVHNGPASSSVWAPANISGIEEHPCYKLYFEDKQGNNVEITSSVNHRWYRRSNKTEWERVTTEELKVGDYAPITKPPRYYKPNSRWKENIGSRRRDWSKLTSIERLEGTHPVLCAEVPGYEQFVIDGFILTSNCAFYSTETIDVSFSEPFTFLMDMSMLGVGVGFDTKGEGRLKIKKPKIDKEPYVVGDSREGWVDLLRKVIDSYSGDDTYPDSIDYSQIREKGSPIRGFGGVASGPAPLKDMIERITEILDNRVGDYITSSDIVDIQNLIGRCVVAGNVRRCLPEDTLIHTDRGLLPIKGIEVGDKVLTAGHVSTYSAVTDVIDQGYQQVLVVSTDKGTLECTGRHKIAVGTVDKYRFKRADQLTKGDSLVFLEDDFKKAEVVSVSRGRVKHTYDLSVAKVHEFVADGFLVHNSAEIAFGEPEDDEFLSLKDPEKNAEALMGWRWSSNNSVFGYLGMDYSKVAELTAKNGEPGYMWLENARAYGRMKDLPDWKDQRAAGGNPCFSGDTLVAVADGRHAVPFEQLAEEGDDVPVYCVDDKGKVHIKWGRNPRKTRKDANLLKVVLDDGSELKVTPDHTMILRDGSMKEAKDLKEGDSLTRFQKYKEYVSKDNPGRYFTVVTDTVSPQKKNSRMWEHRLVAKFFYCDEWDRMYDENQKNGWCEGGLVVHHKDYDPSNNAPENLEIMTFQAHAKLHGEKDNKGENNPMWGRKHKTETLEKIGRATRKRVQNPEFRKKLAESHTEAERRSASERMKNRSPEQVKRSLRAAAEAKFGREKALQIESEKEAARSTDLDTLWFEGRLHVKKNCGICEGCFVVSWGRRQQMFCSTSCANKVEDSKKRRKEGQQVFFNSKQQETLHQQVGVYKTFKTEKGQDPQKKEWEEACKKQGVPCRIRGGKVGQAKSLENPHVLTSFKQLKEISQDYNHRVVSIEEVEGQHDVYNISVDDHYTIGVITKNSENKKSGIITANCLEQTLESAEMCNLVETFPNNHETYDDFQKTLKYAYLYAKSVTLVPTHNAKTNNVMLRNRRIGCSMSGIVQAMQKHGRRELFDWCDKGYDYIEKLDDNYSQWLCIRTSIKKTSVKPSGCRPWYALTTTNKGILTQEELFENHPDDQKWAEHGDVSAVYEAGSATVTRTYNNGNDNVLRITTSYGIEVESTYDHQWWVDYKYQRHTTPTILEANNWKKAEELNVNDVLKVSPGVYRSQVSASLSKVNSLALKMRGDAQTITQPDTMDEDLAWLLGYFWGDGSMSSGKHRIRFSDERKENIDKCVHLIREKFGLEANVYTPKNRNIYSIEIPSKYLWHWMIKNDIHKMFSKDIDSIPECVRRSSRKDILAFMSGLLDADGWAGIASNGSSKLVWSTASEVFAKHFQNVALAVGIILSRSHNTQGENKQERKSMYSLALSSYAEDDAMRVLVKNSNKATKTESADGFYGWHHVTSSRGLILGKVIKLEDIGKMPTYDVEVEGTNWYYAGAIKSHNTVSLLASATPGIHYPHSEYYYRVIRFSSDSTMLKALQEAGYQSYDLAPNEPYTYAVYFPIREEYFDRAKDDVSMWEQLENAAQMQTWWADNQVSCTVSFKPEESDQIKYALELYETRLKGVSFLPSLDHGFKHAPYQAIDEDEYNRALAKLKPLDLSGADHEKTDSFCDGETCEIDFGKESE